MIKDDIVQKMTDALKGKRKTELKVLRFILSRIQYEEINKQKQLTDEEVVLVLQKEVKKRKEAVKLFKKGNRQELVDDEEAQIKIIETYLPKQMSESDLAKVIDEVMVKTDKSTSNMGKIMKAVLVKVKGQADGATVATLVRQKLTESNKSSP